MHVTARFVERVKAVRALSRWFLEGDVRREALRTRLLELLDKAPSGFEIAVGTFELEIRAKRKLAAS